MNLIHRKEQTGETHFNVKPAKQRILYQLLAILLLASLIPLTISAIVLIQRNKEYLEYGVMEMQNRVARNLTSYIEQFVRNVWRDLEIISENQFTSGVLQLDVSEKMGYLAKYEEIVQIYVEKEGDYVVMIKEDQGIPQGTPKIQETEEFKRVYNRAMRGLPAITQPYQSPQKDDLLMLFALPLRYEDGLVACEISLKPIMNLVAADSAGKQNINVAIGRRGFAYIVDSRGRLIAHPDRDLALQQKNMADVAIVSDYLNSVTTGVSNAGTTTYTDENGIEQLGSYQNISFLSQYGVEGGLGWGIIIQEPKSDAYHTVTQMRKITFAWTIGTAILATFLAIAFASRITRPIGKFVISALRIAKGNFKEKVDVESGNEIGQLAATFNYMTEQLELYDREMKELFLNTIKSLVAAMDAKDPYTRGHSERVTKYSLIIGKELGLPKEEMEKLHIGGLLHDIGKIAIVDQVLNKKDALTNEEFQYMRTHPVKGAKIMKHIPQLEDIIPIMKYHHEWFDGNGYPDGLKGEEIPFLARIVCLADTYDAMTTDRPYQKGMDPNFVEEKIIGWSETRYDPKIVEAFVRAFEKGKFTDAQFEDDLANY